MKTWFSGWAQIAALAFLVPQPLHAEATAPFDHSLWNKILETYVDGEGRVAYRDLAAKDRPKLEAYLEAIASADVTRLPVKEALAFYLNANNACVFRGVLDGGSAEGVLGRARFFRFTTYRVAGKKVTLDELEQKIIRPRFQDARVHFALVCASASCPRLARRAFTGENLDALLHEQGRVFLADRFRNPLGPGPEIRVSMIFNWYAEDFVAGAGSVGAFIARYAGDSSPACLPTNTCSYSHVEYDWTLNAQTGQRP